MNIILATITVAIFCIPNAAYALPTPDFFVSLINVIPLLAGTAVTIGGGLYCGLKDRIGSYASRFVLVGLIFLFGIVLLIGYVWNQNRYMAQIENIAMYTRCDINAHEVAVRNKKMKDPHALEKWREYGNFQKIVMADVPNLLRKQPDAALISTSKLSIRHYSGIPTVNIDGQLYPFSHVRSMELVEALQEKKTKDLYLIDFEALASFPELFSPNKSVFHRFTNIYIVEMVKPSDRYIYGDEGLQPAEVYNRIIDWPLEREAYYYDERPINFPGIVRLLRNDKVVDLLNREEVFIVAPYTSTDRSFTVQEEIYLKRLLVDVNPERIIAVDMDLPTTSQKINDLAVKLDGVPFIIVGLTKHDWIYYGLDAAFELWQRMGNDPNRFQLLGFNVRLPEVVAIRWEKRNRRGIIDSLRKPFWKTVKGLNRHLHLSIGAAILVIALGLRFVLFPVGYLEACSRVKRARIKQLLAAENRPVWSGAAATLARHVKVSTGWELFGALIMLILVLPAYKILSVPPKAFDNIAFLWIHDIAKPDYILSVFVGLLIFVKLRLGSATARLLTTLALSGGFVLLLVHLPSSLLVYVSGVLAVTIIQDFLAINRADITLSRALLKKV